MTECSPVVAVNTPDFRAAGFFQPGSRRGSVGHPLPGVAVRGVVDPETWRSAAARRRHRGDGPGQGPERDAGYLGRDDLTAEAMRDGWYVTGDLGLVDEDGFLKITGRLSRFSKIGGEMVPHGRVEEALNEAIGAERAGLRGHVRPRWTREGDRLAVLHTSATIAWTRHSRARKRGLPNLFIPRRDHFVKVDALPMLGTGKLDLRALKRIAAEAIGNSTVVEVPVGGLSQ